jgi:peptidyl-prolyl cis-trans isomerase A (cyclophilin A)
VIGDGGRLVVPGVGESLRLLRGGRLQPTAALAGEVVAADGAVEPWPPREGSVGARARLQVVAHPDVEIVISPVAMGVAIERTRVRMFPPRETLAASAIAACLAAFFGSTAAAEVLPWRDRKPQVEPEPTAIVDAVFTAPRVEVVALPPAIVATPAPMPETDPEPTALASSAARGMVDRPGIDMRDDGDAHVPVDPPVLAAARDDASKPRGRGRRGRPRPTKLPRFDAELGVVVGSVGSATAILDGGDLPTDMLVESVREASIDPRPIATGGPGMGVVVGTGTRGTSTDAPRGDDVATVREAETIDATRSPGPSDVRVVEAELPPPDPRGGKFSLADALAGRPDLASDAGGELVARMHTSKGVIECELFDDRAPATVANFVGLALGTRESFDRTRNAWRRTKLYDGTIFHRVVKGFVIQGGDPEGRGTGGPGYEIADEIVADLKHDAAGVLSMANRGPNTGGSQFFITLAGARQIDGTSTVFGRCDTAVPLAIGDVPVEPSARPSSPVTLDRVEIVRRSPAAGPGTAVTPDASAPPPASTGEPMRPPEIVAPVVRIDPGAGE